MTVAVDRPIAPPRPWVRAFRDLPREHGFEPLRVEGDLPVDLEGTFFKNGAGRFGVGAERYGHWFDADGAVTAVRFAGGKAEGAVRLVRTPAFERQEREGRRLFGGYDTPFSRPLRELFLRDRKNPANTSVVLWQGRLFALCEAGLPFEIDRASLATLGERDLGAITGAFSAHPHDVPARRAFYNFGIENGLRARLAAYELPYAGRARKIAEVTIPGPTMVHDFVVTPRHVVFSVAPMRMRLGPLLLRRVGAMTAMEWRAERGSELIVVPIDDPGATFRVQVDAHYMEHVANAFEEGSTLTFDFIRYPDARGLEDFVGRLAHGTIGAPLQSSICRAVIDLAARRARFEPLLVAPCELPRVSPRVDAARHRFVYAAGFSSVVTARESFFDAVLKLDTEGGTVDRWALPDGHLCSEALFVPRRSPVSEDDGALLTMAFDPASDRSYLAVLDARAPAAPPRAKVWFDHAIPPGFHGIFAAR